jgi:hypothetical protein
LPGRARSEDENDRTKRIVGDQSLHIDTLKIAALEKVQTPA